MSCQICRNLQRDYEDKLGEYIAARSSASFGMSKKLAAQKNVEMERARYELEEHRILCVPVVKPFGILPVRNAPTSLRKWVA